MCLLHLMVALYTFDYDLLMLCLEWQFGTIHGIALQWFCSYLQGRSVCVLHSRGLHLSAGCHKYHFLVCSFLSCTWRTRPKSSRNLNWTLTHSPTTHSDTGTISWWNDGHCHAPWMMSCSCLSVNRLKLNPDKDGTTVGSWKHCNMVLAGSPRSVTDKLQ